MMNKLIEFINSDTIDKNNLFYLKFGTSLASFTLILFFVVPILISTVKEISGISRQATSNLYSSLDIFLYYILNPVIAILLVQQQNRKLKEKPLKIKKIYGITISLILWLFIGLSIFGHFMART
jgi:hypothetical protein